MLMSFEMGFLVGLGVVWGLRGSSGCDFEVWFLVEKCFGNAWILAFFLEVQAVSWSSSWRSGAI
jgi:hypothetical protein